MHSVHDKSDLPFDCCENNEKFGLPLEFSGLFFLLPLCILKILFWIFGILYVRLFFLVGSVTMICLVLLNVFFKAAEISISFAFSILLLSCFWRILHIEVDNWQLKIFTTHSDSPTSLPPEFNWSSLVCSLAFFFPACFLRCGVDAGCWHLYVF